MLKKHHIAILLVALVATAALLPAATFAADKEPVTQPANDGTATAD